MNGLLLAAVASTIAAAPFHARQVETATAYAGFARHGDGIVGWENGKMLERAPDGSVRADFGAPAGYAAFNSFVALDPAQAAVWVGFTTQHNADDRLYKVDLRSKTWTQVGKLAGAFDLAFGPDGRAYVSGLLDGQWGRSGIWLVDGSGRNQHDLILAAPGLTSGLALDASGNLYYAATTDGDATLERYDAAAVRAAEGPSNLTPAQGVALTTVPGGVWDVDVDAAGHVVFDANAAEGSDGLVGVWNGTPGAAPHYRVIATTKSEDAFLTMLEARGDVGAAGDVLVGDFTEFGLSLLGR